jgi:hypothetical protein
MLFKCISGKVDTLLCAALLLCVTTSIKYNAYTLEKSKINDIITENYIEYPLEWEICSVNDDICCMYDVTISEKSKVDILLMWENYSEILTVYADQNGIIKIL